MAIFVFLKTNLKKQRLKRSASDKKWNCESFKMEQERAY